MKLSRFYKIFDWVLVALSYLAVLLFYNGAIAYNINSKTSELMNPLCLAGVVLYVIIFIIQIIAYLVGIIYGVIAKESLAKHNMIIKIVSIPFFIINAISFYFLSIHMLSISLNYLFIVIPLAVIFTFSVMMRSSISNVIYFIKSYIKKTLKVTPWAIIALIFSFIFFFDVIAGIILYNHEKNQREDIALKIKAKRLKKIEEWKQKKHMSLRVFKSISIACTALLSLTSGYIVAVAIEPFIISTNDGNASSPILFVMELFITSIIASIILSVVKLIVGLIYGKRGEEDPTSFLYIMKMVDIVPSIFLLLGSLFFVLIGTVMNATALFLVCFLAIVIIIFVIIALIGVSIAMYVTSIQISMSFLFLSWSTSLSIFTYFINQRAMKNKKFMNPLIIVCLICLWVPIIDIPAIIILKNKSKNNRIFGNTPVITE